MCVSTFRGTATLTQVRGEICKSGMMYTTETWQTHTDDICPLLSKSEGTMPPPLVHTPTYYYVHMYIRMRAYSAEMTKSAVVWIYTHCIVDLRILHVHSQYIPTCLQNSLTKWQRKYIRTQTLLHRTIPLQRQVRKYTGNSLYDISMIKSEMKMQVHMYKLCIVG